MTALIAYKYCTDINKSLKNSVMITERTNFFSTTTTFKILRSEMVTIITYTVHSVAPLQQGLTRESIFEILARRETGFLDPKSRDFRRQIS
jgi:hypothetical protein